MRLHPLASGGTCDGTCDGTCVGTGVGTGVGTDPYGEEHREAIEPIRQSRHS